MPTRKAPPEPLTDAPKLLAQLRRIFDAGTSDHMRIKPSRQHIEMMLRQHSVPYESWPEIRGYVHEDGTQVPGMPAIELLLEEVLTNQEAELLVTWWQGVPRIVRRIQTVTLKVFNDQKLSDDSPLKKRLILREWRWKDGSLVARQHPNSMSEKLRKGEDNHVNAVRRALCEELSIILASDDELLRYPHLCGVPVESRDVVQQMATRRLHTDIPYHAGEHVDDSRKYPGLITWNSLHHFYWIMPGQFYHDEYVDAQTGHVFRWEPC